MDITFLLLIKILFTIFVIILVPIYWKNYGYQNFLWFSDVGLLLTVPALWLNSRLLMSMLIISILPLELIWNIDYFYRLISGRKWLGIVDYMFDSKLSPFLRSLSFFHTVLPVVWFWCLYLWGYDPRAFIYAVLLVWLVLILTYFFSDPKENINWVFHPIKYHWQRMPEWLWLVLLLIGTPLVILWPMHLLLKYVVYV